MFVLWSCPLTIWDRVKLTQDIRAARSDHAHRYDGRNTTPPTRGGAARKERTFTDNIDKPFWICKRQIYSSTLKTFYNFTVFKNRKGALDLLHREGERERERRGGRGQDPISGENVLGWSKWSWKGVGLNCERRRFTSVSVTIRPRRRPLLYKPQHNGTSAAGGRKNAASQCLLKINGQFNNLFVWFRVE